MARDDHLGGPCAHSTTAETPWPRRESHGLGGGERSSGCHRSPAAARPAPPPAASLRVPRSAARARVTEGVHGRCDASLAHARVPVSSAAPPAAPGIPRPVRLGRRTEHQRERRLRPTQRDPALPQRAELHDVTPCHRRRPPRSAGVALGVLQSANRWGRPVTLFAAHSPMESRTLAQSAFFLGKWRARQDSNLRPPA